ncbi:MAG TPA: TadE family protein [Patescibacteria group bacterium]|nr:TadE family protein [Patescibacteria group bacterium]
MPRRSERGAEVVEFAFVITALAALMFGIISFARAYNIYQTITRAAREGARMAALPSSVYDGDSFLDGTTTYTSPTSPIFLNYIAPALKAANLNANACAGAGAADCVANYNEQVGWLAPSGTADNQCGISISFTYPYPLAIPFLGKGIGTLNLHTSVQMRREDQPAPGSTTCP